MLRQTQAELQESLCVHWEPSTAVVARWLVAANKRVVSVATTTSHEEGSAWYPLHESFLILFWLIFRHWWTAALAHAAVSRILSS